MMSADRDALVCDLAETYGIYDMRALPVNVLATLAVGLREESRIKTKMLGDKPTRGEMLLAAIVDRLTTLLWMLTSDGREGTNRPKSILDMLLGDVESGGQVDAFESADDFEAEWTRRTGVSHGR